MTIWLFNREQMALGLSARDIVTGFAGVVTAVAFYIDGSAQALIEARFDPEGKAEKDGRWISSERLELLAEFGKVETRPPSDGRAAPPPEEA